MSNYTRIAAILFVTVWIYAVFAHGSKPRNPLSRKEVGSWTPNVAEESPSEQAPPVESEPEQPTYDYAPDEAAAAVEEATSAALLASIKDYVDTPEDGIDWQLFGQTKQKSYAYADEAGRKWIGVRPEFPKNLQRLDGRQVLIKGFMFPLGQEEKQPRFLMGPFPVSCPFHYDVTPSLIIEVHAKKPVAFSYNAVSIRGQLELVPQDDEYNVFYRLKNAKRIP